MRIRLTTKYGVKHTTKPTMTDMVILTTLRFDVIASLVGTPTAHGDEKKVRWDERQRGGS